MIVTKVGRMDALSQINRLIAAGYNPPRGTDPGAIAEQWVFALDGVQAHELRGAVDQYLRSDRAYFPKPGALRRAALDSRRSDGVTPAHTLQARYLRWEASTEGECPVCGATMRELGWRLRGAPEGAPSRLAVLHDAAMHREKGVPHVGPPYPRRPPHDRGPR